MVGQDGGGADVRPIAMRQISFEIEGLNGI